MNNFTDKLFKELVMISAYKDAFKKPERLKEELKEFYENLGLKVLDIRNTHTKTLNFVIDIDITDDIPNVNLRSWTISKFLKDTNYNLNIVSFKISKKEKIEKDEDDKRRKIKTQLMQIKIRFE